MDAGCYVPNNPSHFGLELLPPAAPGPGGWPPSPSSSPPHAHDEMAAAFPLPTLELDTALFPFSPQAGAYKCEYSNSKDRCLGVGSVAGGNVLSNDAFLGNPLIGAPGHDMADVLLSLKHAVVHPGQLSPNGFAAAAAAAVGYPTTCQYQGPSASLSYTVHPHQMLSPGNGSYGGYSNCGPGELSPGPGNGFGSSNTSMNLSGGSGTCSGGFGISSQNSMQGQTSFPSMSVNVSMNMTMHGYPAPIANANLQEQICPQWDVVQMQWTPQTSQSPVYPSGQAQSLLSPQTATAYGGATYSFTADFRSPMPSNHSSCTTATSNIQTPSALSNLGLPIDSCISSSPTGISNSFHKNVKQGPTTPMLYHSPPCARTTPTSGVEISLGSGNSSKRNHFASKSSSLSLGSCSPHMTHLQGEECSRPNLCRICGKTYARPSTLKTHLRTHSGEKPYRCADCHKSFSQAANLTAHVRTHSGEKPFRCPICDRRFSQSSSVTTHMRTHSGERPYRCRLCKKAFSDSSTLTKHLRIHSGEKPYQCKLCLLRFSQSGNLNRHMRVHGASGGLPSLPV